MSRNEEFAAGHGMPAESTTTLYRGERGHDRPSFYPKSGPNALAGAWWTDDHKKAWQYSGGKTDSNVYAIDVHPHEFEPRGAKGNYVILDAAVRARRTLAQPPKSDR